MPVHGTCAHASTKRHPRLMRLISGLAMLLLGALTLAPRLYADGTDPQDPLQQRTRFLAAKKALENGNAEVFLQNASTLQDYPLYPYLVYWHLMAHLDEQSNATIQAFLDSNDDMPLAPQLRTAWLMYLAGEQRWEDFQTFYRGSRSSELRCDAHLAELKTGEKAKAWAGAQQLWLVGHSQNDACDPLFTAWEKAGGLDEEMRQQRIDLALARGNGGLAGYLAKPLSEDKRNWVALWRRVDNHPEIIRDEPLLKKDNEQNRRIIKHGLNLLAGRDPTIAATLWPSMSQHYHFDKKDRRAIERRIALNFALDGDNRALNWYAKLPRRALGKNDAAWAVRAAMRRGLWQAAVDWIAKVPQSDRASEQWRYWLARAEEALGKTKQAAGIYQELSQNRSYYGFLAADRSDNPYNLEHEPLEVSDEALEALQQKPALIRARELYHLTLTNDARREWDYAVAHMNHQERLAAGKLADKWKWYDRALLTLARADHFDDLNIRFPLAYHEAVLREAQKRGIDPSWVYAIARQESAFIEDVQSSAGALGLMQLMPGTGRNIARQLNTQIDNSSLLQPETNIRFGSYYLQQVLNRFDDNPVLATAAYNAGPLRIEQWTPKSGSIDADIWVDTMPYHETRQYVRRVMAYSVFYDQRLERPITRLRLRMPAISNKDDALNNCDDCSAAKDEKG